MNRTQGIHVYASEAHRIVDDVIEKACKRLLSERDTDVNKNISEISLSFESDKRLKEAAGGDVVWKTENGNVLPNIKWMSIQDFSIQNGLAKIEEYIQTWNRDVSWLHCIDFLKEEDCPYSKRYRYEVKWSIPTRRKPIPRATASTYFTLDVSNIKPKNYPVEVYYVFEGHRLVHRPGMSRFNEKWLKDIIESKVHLMESIKF